MKKSLFFMLFLLLFPIIAFCAGNEKIANFNEAKYLLEHYVYFDHRETIYCQLEYDEENKICLPKGFIIPNYYNRSKKVEWEHVVPAENFGSTFKEWTDGDKICYNKNKRKYFKGRKCAELTSKDFRKIESDLYNLYPADGAVNALRQNYTFTKLDYVQPTFGICPMKIYNNQAEPPDKAKGMVARTYLYMEDSYPKNFKMDDETKNLMLKWDKQFPVTEWECTRAKRIEKIQGNSNIFVKNYCD